MRAARDQAGQDQRQLPDRHLPRRGRLRGGLVRHVFVERATRKPTPIPTAIRNALERIATAPR